MLLTPLSLLTKVISTNSPFSRTEVSLEERKAWMQRSGAVQKAWLGKRVDGQDQIGLTHLKPQ